MTLLVADNKTGYFGVYHQSDKLKPYAAQVRRGGKVVSLGTFATAEEAALCVARSPEGRAAAAAAPLTVNHGKCGHYTRRRAWARILANIRAHSRCRVY